MFDFKATNVRHLLEIQIVMCWSYKTLIVEIVKLCFEFHHEELIKVSRFLKCENNEFAKEEKIYEM